MRLSFIVPFYNGGCFFKQCLDSICGQDLEHCDYEVLIIDDCSPNLEAVERLKKYVSLHDNVRYIRNEYNLRAGGSRDVGIHIAKGDYLWFVDQDDYISLNCARSLIGQCEDDRLDILYFDFSKVKASIVEKQNVVKKDIKTIDGLKYIVEYCNGDFWGNGYDTNMWHALYRRDFLLSHGIKIPAISYCEDLIFAQQVIVMNPKMGFNTASCYFYRQNPDSVFFTEVGKNGRCIFDACIYVGASFISFMQLLSSKYQSLQSALLNAGINRINSFTSMLLRTDRGQKHEFYHCVADNEDVMKIALPFLTTFNKWILTHESCVFCFPFLLRAFNKLL